MTLSNALLAQQFREDDDNAFAQLVGRHHSLVFNVCLKILRHQQDAEDATQETFSRAAKYLHRWDSKRPIEPWLLAIAGNRCRTLLAKKRVHRSLSPAIEPQCDELRAEHAADSLREEVALALSHLPRCQRLAFELFHEHSLSYAEIAERMDCPIGTAKTWVHRARGNLIQQLQQREVIDQPGRPGDVTTEVPS